MKKGITLAGAAGAGAALMYLFDPDRGKSRRALVRNKTTHMVKKTGDALGKTSRDLRNHARGVVAEAKSLFRSEVVSDEVLAARVRSKMGRVVSHPSAIEAKVNKGNVTLSGPVLACEVDRLLKCTARVHGVVAVEDRLDVHEKADEVPALQGGRVRRGEPFRLTKTKWTPAMRLAATLAGGAAAHYGVRRRGIVGTALSSVGWGLLLLTSLEGKRPNGAGAGRRGVEIRKTINVNAPVERVFEFWTHPENFPQFMSHVREVTQTGDGRYHWVVGGPAGVAVEWDAEVTEFVPLEALAWKSVEGAMIEQSGITRFRQNQDGSTRVEVNMSYDPPAGYVGHAVAELFHADPKHEMDDDLLRMKTFIETGHVAHDASFRAHCG